MEKSKRDFAIIEDETGYKSIDQNNNVEKNMLRDVLIEKEKPKFFNDSMRYWNYMQNL